MLRVWAGLRLYRWFPGVRELLSVREGQEACVPRAVTTFKLSRH